MAFHALIGAGFLAATFLVRPFLPDNKMQDIDQICGRVRVWLPKLEMIIFEKQEEPHRDYRLFVSSGFNPFIS